MLFISQVNNTKHHYANTEIRWDLTTWCDNNMIFLDTQTIFLMNDSLHHEAKFSCTGMYNNYLFEFLVNLMLISKLQEYKLSSFYLLFLCSIFNVSIFRSSRENM